MIVEDRISDDLEDNMLRFVRCSTPSPWERGKGGEALLHPQLVHQITHLHGPVINDLFRLLACAMPAVKIDPKHNRVFLSHIILQSSYKFFRMQGIYPAVVCAGCNQHIGYANALFNIVVR